MSDEKIPYSGPERRVAQRRKENDRRVLIRFEQSKKPRRKNNGRRQEDVQCFNSDKKDR